MIGVGFFLTLGLATGPFEPLHQRPLGGTQVTRHPHGPCEIAGGRTHELGRFGETAVRGLSAPREEEPVLDQHADAFGVDLGQHAGRAPTTGFVHLAVALPQLVQQFNLP